MKRIDKLQKFLNQFTPNVYWATSYNGKISRDIDVYDTDWNQTLMTKINEVASRIYKDGGTGGPNRILISGQHSDMQGLFNSLLYMKLNFIQDSGFYCIGKLAGRYDVLVIPNLPDEKKIYVCEVHDTTKNPFNVLNYMKVAVVQILKLDQE